MRLVVRFVICTGMMLLSSACMQKSVDDRPIVQPRGAVTDVTSSPSVSSTGTGDSLTNELNAQKSLRRVAEIAKAITSGDTGTYPAKSSGDAFLDAAYALLKASQANQLDKAIKDMNIAMEKTKPDTARYNLGSILLSEARDRQQLAAASADKESEIVRLKREAFLLKQKLAETENKLRELATIEDELTRTRPKTPPASQ